MTQVPRVNILSYSGSADGRILLNTRTIEAQLEPWDAVSDIIAAFNGSSFFANAYVPSITRGETDQGTRFLSFILNLQYVPEKSLAATQAQTTDNTGASQTAPKVPRQ